MHTDDTFVPGDTMLALRKHGKIVRSKEGWGHWIVLALILLLAAFLNFWRLNQLGYGNGYYAAGVRSMLDSWHNFFFVSFDPAGFVTIDKPPLGFWLQAASARLFGFSGFSLLLPEAIAGVLSVALLYHLVARIFGRWAGNIAALMLAITPLSVATSRYNTIDMLLVFCVLLATWTLLRAIESGRIAWLLLTALLIGLGFNIKMLEAYLILPAFGLLFLLGSPRTWSVRILQLLLALVIMLVVSFSWIVVVDAIPAAQRPYVGSTSDNSELSLALGYNGLQRLLGRNSHLFTTGQSAEKGRQTANTGYGNNALPMTYIGGVTLSSSVRAEPPTAPERQEVNAPGSGGVGHPGTLRFWGPDFSNQISWLLPLAFVSLLALAWQRRWRFPLTIAQLSLLLWAIWMITMVIFFSAAGFFNVYYMVMLAPAICALAAAGLVVMWRDYVRRSWRGWLLPIALLVIAVSQAHFLSYYPALSVVLQPLVVGGCIVVAIALALGLLWPRPQRIVPAVPTKIDAQRTLELGSRNGWWWFASVLLLCALALLLLAPFIWSSYTVLTQTGVARTAGPKAETTFQGYVDTWKTIARTHSATSGATKLSKLDRYLLKNRQGAEFLLATPSSGTADNIILDTNEPVMAWGGFGGHDPILSTQQLVGLVDNGTVRYVLLQNVSSNFKYRSAENISFPAVAQPGNVELSRWVSASCSPVPLRLWSSTHSKSSYRASNGEVLFDCSRR